ncbi:P1 family peptidase [Corallococcus sp. bb12-1]|uniref:DmpA family aminopeptidase n=1 Tax=Corallococcus sp. bb12-1 TaxID=2996784 RepID=UPI00226E729E|nr:P1 family peptidase [Corallococcus sp. bb12-1]MCY1042655.1 P1 family peptidase [Corallococcus sp. bb12-1]
MKPARPVVPPGLLCLLLLLPLAAPAQTSRPRARASDLGISFGGTPGALNAITDVKGVEVGHTTLHSGGAAPGAPQVRTGVTAVLPRGRDAVAQPVFAATYALNGSGEMTGTHWVKESGLLSGPVMITNTHAVGAVHEGVIAWAQQRNLTWELGLPVVAETWDGMLNDIDGFHVRPTHAMQAMDAARPGPVPEGSVGGGTGMVCHGFKGGIGTSSRRLPAEQGGYTLGVLVQCNYGSRRLLSVAGVPVGEVITDLRACYTGAQPPKGPFFSQMKPCAARAGVTPTHPEGMGSIIVVVATDAPLLPHQLDRIARRVPLALGKMGALGEDFSGDIFLAFSTQRTLPVDGAPAASVAMLENERLNPLFEATVQATQEAILNAMLVSDTMTGNQDARVYGLPHDRLVQVLRKAGRLPPAPKPKPGK